ncbi:MAG: DUF1080 domain-containing protein [Kiritimatiellia bacterium]|jgi:hypothetical protein|nr:DUF1080 domain-containing protein [Kiritimatiellia bacterium]
MTASSKPLLALLALFCAAAPSSRAAEPVKSKVDVIDLLRQGQVDLFLNPKAVPCDPPENVFQARDGELRISGAGFGYLATRQAYRNYHLVLEFKWGPRTWGQREKRARDNGILVHAYGPHGAYGETFMASIEAQIIEGGMGDFLVLGATLPDGTRLDTRLDCEYELDRDGEKRWRRGAPRQTVRDGRVNWEQRDEDWEDRIGFRGAFDPDAPAGGWNRMEVIARDDTLLCRFNGRVVNEGFAAQPKEGRVCIQTEGAEMIVRRFELWPLGTFKETWPPEPPAAAK